LVLARAHVLTAGHRQVIEHLWGQGKTFAEIAAAIGVGLSSVWREIKRAHSARHGTKNPLGATRGGLYRWGYRADWAQRKAAVRRRRPKSGRLARPGPLRDTVVQWLGQRWSPRQIAARLLSQFPGRPEMRVSHETIYQSIYLQARGSLRELVADTLRTGRRQRRSQSRAATAARRAVRGRPWVTEQVHISARPAEVADRAVPLHAPWPAAAAAPRSDPQADGERKPRDHDRAPTHRVAAYHARGAITDSHQLPDPTDRRRCTARFLIPRR